MSAGRYDEAEAELRRAVEISPAHPQPHLMLSATLLPHRKGRSGGERKAAFTSSAQGESRDDGSSARSTLLSSDAAPLIKHLQWNRIFPAMMYERVLLVSALAAALLPGQTDWPVFGHDPGARRFSPLKQINVGNIKRLQRAWTFHTGKPGSEGIPIVVGGVMYLAAANGLFAIEPETGKQIWHFEATQVALRGLAYWPGDKTTHPRVFAGVKGGMIALDATTG